MAIVVGNGPQPGGFAVALDGVVGARVEPNGVLLKADSAVFRGLGIAFRRRDPDGVQRWVRSGEPAAVSNSFSVAFNGEAPYGVPVTYSAALYDPRYGLDSIEGYTQPVTVTVPAPATSTLAPVSKPSATATFLVRSVGELKRDRASQVVRVLERPDPVVVEGVRSLPQYDLTLFTNGAAESAKMQETLQVGGTYLLRSSVTSGLPDAFCRFPSDSTSRVTRMLYQPDRDVTLPVVEVARPATRNAPLRIPGKSFGDLTGSIGAQSGTFRQRLLA